MVTGTGIGSNATSGWIICVRIWIISAHAFEINFLDRKEGLNVVLYNLWPAEYNLWPSAAFKQSGSS